MQKMEKESFDLNINSNLELLKDVGLYWIHCNHCFEIYIRKRRRFFLLSCNHIICETCAATPSINHLNLSGEGNCPICKKRQHYRVICNVMPARAKELLDPEPWHEPNERILNFQATQKEYFKNGIIRQQLQMEKINRKCNAMEITLRNKYERCEQLRHERKRLERAVLKIKKLELQSKGKYFQAAERGPKGIFNLNNFTGVNRANTNLQSHINGRNLSHTALQNSFPLNLYE